MISWAMKTHMPRVAASFCCSRVAKWWRSGPAWASDKEVLLRRARARVVVGLLVHPRGAREVLGGRRRGDAPLESGGGPGIGRGNPAIPHRPGQVEDRKQEAHPQDRRPRGGH